MQKNKDQRLINFVKMAKYVLICSSIFIVIGIVSISINKGFRLGVDFAGGKEIHLSFNKQTLVTREKMEEIFTENNIKASITELGSNNQSSLEYLIYYPSNKEIINTSIKEAFNKRFGKEKWLVVSESFVGPKIGKQFQLIATYATVITLILLLIYIALRFELSFGISALISLIHDIVIVLCFISLAHISFDIPALAAILTIIGYSLNDTIVIFDRIRTERAINEDLSSGITLTQYEYFINLGINKSLSRTFLTAGTTLTVLLVLYLIGSLELKPMTLILIIGIIVGTLSSNFVAPPFLKWLHKRQLKKQ
jgi:preprotein translocase SecF subunit